MRLMGYPAHKITILTTDNGQKALIHDVIERRCAASPMLGRPHKVRGRAGAGGGGEAVCGQPAAAQAAEHVERGGAVSLTP